MKQVSGRGSSDLSVLLYPVRGELRIATAHVIKDNLSKLWEALMGGAAEIIDVAELRERLRKMTDPRLRDYGNDLRRLCKSARKQGKEPEMEFVIRLEEATLEWRRRKNPKTANTK
jgi:hypothetical protein